MLTADALPTSLVDGLPLPGLPEGLEPPSLPGSPPYSEAEDHAGGEEDGGGVASTAGGSAASTVVGSASVVQTSRMAMAAECQRLSRRAYCRRR